MTAVICFGAFTPPTQAALKTVGAQEQGRKELQQFKVIFGRGAVRSRRKRAEWVDISLVRPLLFLLIGE